MHTHIHIHIHTRIHAYMHIHNDMHGNIHIHIPKHTRAHMTTSSAARGMTDRQTDRQTDRHYLEPDSESTHVMNNGPHDAIQRQQCAEHEAAAFVHLRYSGACLVYASQEHHDISLVWMCVCVFVCIYVCTHKKTHGSPRRVTVAHPDVQAHTRAASLMYVYACTYVRKA